MINTFSEDQYYYMLYYIKFEYEHNHIQHFSYHFKVYIRHYCEYLRKKQQRYGLKTL